MAETLRPDIAAARSKMRARLGGGREIKRLTEHLWEGETVERMTTGAYGAGTGLIVLTDRRLLFLQDGVISKRSEDFPLEKVSSVQWSTGLALGTIAIFASGNKTELKNVNKDDGKEMVDVVRARVSGPKAGPPSAAGTAHPDIIGQIKQLGELKEAGVLSQEEFEAKKAELLRRL
ncbi:MAG: PH domain-containing protein [Actinomycetota bacterium]